MLKRYISNNRKLPRQNCVAVLIFSLSGIVPVSFSVSRQTANQHTHDDQSQQAGAHNTVGKYRIRSMALDMILHISAKSQQGSCHQPQHQKPVSPPPAAHQSDGKNNDRKTDLQRAQNLNDTDKPIAAKKQGIVPGTVQHHLRSAVAQQKQQAGIAVFLSVSSLLYQAGHK